MTHHTDDQRPDDPATDQRPEGDQEPGDPTRTDHPAGESHADQNAEEESPT